ncbi:hypothetical protein [Acinetobacter sp.]|uniref:hypothetical protein n=1 Tax=Acinetobacter sp. TaxID=472 RepID=UPI00388D6E7E
MSRGKYSPTASKQFEPFDRNSKGELPPATWPEGYDEKVHFANYDANGFDSYGYSAYDAHGTYVGIGEGVDRDGYTEMDYLRMDDEEFYNL